MAGGLAYSAGPSGSVQAITPLGSGANVARPMVFVGLFPVSALPDAIAPVFNALPITLVTTAMRQIVEDPSASLVPQFTGLGIWAMVSLAAAARAFRWE